MMVHYTLATTIAHDEQILLIRMSISLKRLEAREPLLPQAVLGQHAADGFAEDLAAAPFLHELVHGDFLERARARRVCAVQFLRALLARCVQLRAVGGDHVVAAVGRRVEDWFVLAHECQGYRRGDSSERPWVAANVEVVP